MLILMVQVLTDINSNFIYSDNKAKVTDENLNNGDLAFCAEDKSITLKYNDSLYNMGGTEVADASDTVKGITKLSDAIDRDDSTIATTSKAVKTTYDEATNAKTKANEAYAMGESLTSRIEVIEDKVLGYNGSIIGVACTGEYTNDGATLAWINGNFNKVTKLTDNYFDNHPSYKFEETMFGSDVMIKIPLCYWWRGTIPSGPYQGKWGMLLSPVANPGIEGLTFKPNYVAFMDNGTMYDQFYYSKYRARSDGSNVSVSTSSGGTQWKSINFKDAETYCANKGTGWHLQSCQQWHEICTRAVVEKKTFQLVAAGDRLYNGSNTKTRYRGIMEFCEDKYNVSSSTGVLGEWMHGIRSKQLSYSSSQCTIQTFSNDGRRTWVDAYTEAGNGSYYSAQLISNQYMDNLFINDAKIAGTLGTNAIIPDYTSVVGYTGFATACNSYFDYRNEAHGAFYVKLDTYPESTITDARIGFRSSFIGVL